MKGYKVSDSVTKPIHHICMTNSKLEIHKITFSNENRKMQYPYSTYHERTKFSILKQTGESLPNDMLVMGV